MAYQHLFKSAHFGTSSEFNNAVRQWHSLGRWARIHYPNALDIPPDQFHQQVAKLAYPSAV